VKKILMVTILTGLGLLASQRTSALCLFSCVPTEADGKAYFTNNLKRNYKEQFNITSFEKTNGFERDVFGQKSYTMEFAAIVAFPNGVYTECKDAKLVPFGGIVPGKCADRDDPNKSIYRGSATNMNFKDSLVFQKTEKGWRGDDGQIY
jgi:hypothetical protein